MNGHNSHHEEDDFLFERMLRGRLGPSSVQAPPPALRQAILSRVAGLPAPEPHVLRRPGTWITALALAFLGLVGWWLMGLVPGVSAGQELVAGLRGLGLQAESWTTLLRSPLALSLLPLACLPFLFHHMDEQ